MEKRPKCILKKDLGNGKITNKLFEKALTVYKNNLWAITLSK